MNNEILYVFNNDADAIEIPQRLPPPPAILKDNEYIVPRMDYVVNSALCDGGKVLILDNKGDIEAMLAHPLTRKVKQA